MAMRDETQFYEARNMAKTEGSFVPKLSDCCGAAALGLYSNLTTKLPEIRLLPRQAPWSARALDMLM
jgi:hypothetical protein